MAEGLSAGAANNILNAIFNNTSYAIAQAYIKLHVGAPGAAGTSNPAGNTTRKAISMAVAASGAITSDTDTDWTAGEVNTNEDYTHFSIWDNVSAGNFVASGIVTANAILSGDTFKIPAGDLDFSFPLAS